MNNNEGFFITKKEWSDLVEVINQIKIIMLEILLYLDNNKK